MTPQHYVGLPVYVQKNYRVGKMLTNNQKMPYITKIVCDYFEQDIESVLGSRRFAQLVHVRQISMYFIRKQLKLPLKTIGAFFHIDHSTVIYACAAVQDHYYAEKKFREDIINLEKLL